uniref:Malectin-like domain-containing protein n=1 Tax=Physcomitrium patens TaxID=3218 RepID=A0A2K1JXB4_PHYPA|nr:hypothetical protein PHYPA_013289 [Physcomitrium patens]
MSFGVRTMCTSPGMVFLVLCSHAITLASAQNTTSGWLNINCGATETFVGPKTGLTWVPDGPYITTGELGTVPNANMNFPNFAEARTLRYFTDQRAKKFCYALPVEPLNTYMPRENHFYGNNDDTSFPSFQISVDSVIF